MPEIEKEPYYFFTDSKGDEFEEDIDNYDNELFNVYDDGIGLNQTHSEINDPEAEEDDDEPMEDNLTLPLFSEGEMDEIEGYDEIED